MFYRKKKRKIAIVQSASPTGIAASATTGDTQRPSPQEVLGAVFERVLTIVNDRVRFMDRIAPMVVFVYPDGDEKGAFGDMRAVRISWQGELHKEIIRKKIRDKAILEGATAVILLTERGPSKGSFLLSGATCRMLAHVSVSYTYDAEARVFKFSEMEWIDQPPENFFLDGILLKQ